MSGPRRHRGWDVGWDVGWVVGWAVRRAGLGGWPTPVHSTGLCSSALFVATQKRSKEPVLRASAKRQEHPLNPSIRRLGAMAAGVLAAATLVGTLPLGTANATTTTVPDLTAYRGGGSTGATALSTYETWSGTKVRRALDFTATDSWASLEGPNWQLDPWSASGRQLTLSVPMFPQPTSTSTGSLAACAAGDYDSHWTRLGQNLVAKKLSSTVVRPGWEFNGGWFWWKASVSPSAFAGCFRHVVTAMRAVPGQAFSFDWNPNIGPGQFPAEQAWPGDGYVTTVGVDAYDQSWVSGTYPISSTATAAQRLTAEQTAWKDVLSGDHGLAFWSAFAHNHGAAMSLPEWGLTVRSDGHGGGDNPYYVQQMFAFIKDPANNVSWASYFDFDAPDGTHRVSLATNPFTDGRAAYLSIVQGWATTATATPTASPTATATPTASPTATATASPTATATATPTASPTATPTASPTATATPTASPTATATATLAAPQLLMSTSASRSPASALDGATVTGSLYAFTQDQPNLSSVRFYLDDPTGARPPVHAEAGAPWDLWGGSTTTANAFSLAGTAAGWHTLTVTAVAADGSTRTASSSFLVKVTSSLLVSTSSTRSPSQLLQGTTLSGKVAVFLNAPGASSVRFWLDNPTMTGAPRNNDTLAPYDLLASGSSASMLNLLNLKPGTHSVTALTTFPDGSTWVDSSTFTVSSKSGSTGLIATCGC